MAHITSKEIEKEWKENGGSIQSAKRRLEKRQLEDERQYYLDLVLNGHKGFFQTKDQRIKQLEKGLYWLLTNAKL